MKWATYALLRCYKSVEANSSRNRTGTPQGTITYLTDKVVGIQGPTWILPITGDMDTHTHTTYIYTYIYIYIYIYTTYVHTAHTNTHKYTHSTLWQLGCEHPKSTSGQPSLSVSSPQNPSLPIKGELH